MNARRVAQAGIIAAVYGALTFIAIQFLPLQLGEGFIQFRVSEALTVTALLTPAAVPGLFVGSVLANLSSVAKYGAVGMFDVVLGSVATLLGAAWSWRFRGRTALALAGPVLFNALIVPAYLPLMFGASGITTIPLLNVSLQNSWPVLYGVGFVTIAIGQAVVVYGLGWPLLTVLRRMPLPGLEAEGQTREARGK